MEFAMNFITQVASIAVVLSVVVLISNLTAIWHNLRAMEAEGYVLTQKVVTDAINRRPYLRTWFVMFVLSMAVVVPGVL